MPCCAQCEGIEAQFGEKTAERDLRRYRRKGPIRSTRVLVELLLAQGVEGASLLDVGGGVGAVQHELFAAGLGSATHVDAASRYLAASRAEAERRGHADRVTYLAGDAIDLAPTLSPADLVTLDRVICCYPDLEGLIAATASRARRVYALVFPREHLPSRVTVPLANLFFRLRRIPFRVYLHPPGAVDRAIRREGLRPRRRRRTLGWHVWLYTREDG